MSPARGKVLGVVATTVKDYDYARQAWAKVLFTGRKHTLTTSQKESIRKAYLACLEECIYHGVPKVLRP